MGIVQGWEVQGKLGGMYRGGMIAECSTWELETGEGYREGWLPDRELGRTGM